MEPESLEWKYSRCLVAEPEVMNKSIWGLKGTLHYSV